MNQNKYENDFSNSVEIMQLPLLEPIKDESWDDAERMGQGGNLSFWDENGLTVAGQDCICSSTQHEDWEIGASQPTSKANETAEACGTRGRNQKRSDSLESFSSNKVFNITSVDTGQYRSQRRVETDAHNRGGNLNHNVESECEENMWGPLGNDETSNLQNENQYPGKKHNQVLKNPLPDQNKNSGDSKAACYMPKANDSRTQGQVDWIQNKSHVTNQNGDHDQNLIEPVRCSQGNRTLSQSYMPQASNSRTQEQTEGNLKKKTNGKHKGVLDQNVRELVQRPQRSRRESKTERYIPEASDSRTQGKVAWNQSKSHGTNQNSDHDQNFMELGHSPQRIRRESKTQSCIPEASDSRTQRKVIGIQSKDQIEKQKGGHDQNLRELVNGARRNRKESKTQTYIHETSESMNQEKVDWNQNRSETENQKGDCDHNCRGFLPETQEKAYWNPEKNLIESQNIGHSHNYVPVGMGRGKSLNEIQHQVCFDFRSINLVDRNSVYSSDEEQKTKKDNELDRNKSQGDSSVGSKVQRYGSVSQDAHICRKEETSLGIDEGVGMPEKTMGKYFASKKSEDSGEYVNNNYDGKGVCSDEPQLCDENHNSEMSVESLSFDLSSVQNNPGTVQVSPTYIRETYQHQIPNQFIDPPLCASHLHSVASPPFPIMNSMSGVLPSSGSLSAEVDIRRQPHAQQIPNQAFQDGSQPLSTTDIQKLFEAFVQEQQQRMMSMNYLVQMAVTNRTGLPSTKPHFELQAQQPNLSPMMAGLMNSPRGLSTHSNNLHSQSNSAVLNPSMTPLLTLNQTVPSRNVPLHSEASSFNREGCALLTPNVCMNMNSAGSRSPADSSFTLNHRNQTNIPNMDMMNMNSAGSRSPADFSFTLNHRNQTNIPNMDMNNTLTSVNESALHGNQTNTPLLIPSLFAIGHDHMMPSNYQITQTQQLVAGNMQCMMQHVPPDVYSQPFESRPAKVGMSSRMVIGKGRGRLIT